MPALPGVVELRDIKNVEAFVVDCIKRSGVKLRPGMPGFEDLLMDSIVILYDMASKYQEHMEGYDKKGLFSGYAITYLPRKIKAQYFRAQENALMLTQPDGSRKWEFRAKPISYDHITSNSKDEAPIDERKFRHPGEFTAPPTVDVNYAESISKSNFDFEQSGRWRIDSDA